MGRKPIVAQPKAVKLSDWIKQPGRPVTRGELLNVLRIFIERRFLVEYELQRQRKWRYRIWVWFTSFFTGVRLPTEQEVDNAVEKVFDAKAEEPAQIEEQEQEDESEAVEEGAGEPEQLLEGVNGPVKYRDKRAPR